MEARIMTKDGERIVNVIANNSYQNKEEKYLIYIGEFVVGFGEMVSDALKNASDTLNKYSLKE